MKKKTLSPVTTPAPALSQENLLRLAILASVLRALGLLSGCGADRLFPAANATGCGTSTECMDNEHFGTTADLWCIYNGSLKNQSRGPACLRVPCMHIGQLCETGGVCEPPDELATKHGLSGYCRKFVCSKPQDCLSPTPTCAHGFCIPDHILMFP